MATLNPMDLMPPVDPTQFTNEPRIPPSPSSNPRKRVLLYSVIIACLTIFAFVINLFANLLHDLLKNDQMWEYLSKRKCEEEAVNITC